MNPRPKRGDTWICPICKAPNEPYRAACINTSRHPAPDTKKGGKK